MVRLQSSELVIKAGLAAVGTGNEAEALVRVLAAARKQQTNPHLWQVAGLLYRAQEDSPSAIAMLATAARLAPSSARIAHAHARVTMEAGLPSMALFDRALALAPSDGQLLLSRAAAQLAEGRAAEAIEQLDAVLRGSPHWLLGQQTLTRLRWLSGDVDGFDAGYRRALDDNSRDANLWMEWIGTLIHAERWSLAQAAIGRARTVLGASHALLLSEAICASELDENALADRLFAQLLTSPDIAVAERHLRHLLRTGRPEAAALRAEPLLDHPDANQIWPYMSPIWRLTGDARIGWLDGDPQLVGVYDLDVGDLLAPLSQRLRDLHNVQYGPLGQSVRGGTQTDGPLFARHESEIARLRAGIIDAVQRHIGALGPRDAAHPTRRHVGTRFRFAGSWSVRLQGAGHHANHIHPQGWLSSAFYVVVPGPQQRGPAPGGWLTLGQPPAELGIDLPPLISIEPKPGRLVMFPSTMWHGTLPFEAGERLSVAFDVAPVKVN